MFGEQSMSGRAEMTWNQKASSWERSFHYIGLAKKVRLDFPMTLYRKTWTDFLANPIPVADEIHRNWIPCAQPLATEKAKYTRLQLIVLDHCLLNLASFWDWTGSWQKLRRSQVHNSVSLTHSVPLCNWSSEVLQKHKGYSVKKKPGKICRLQGKEQADVL